MTIENFSKGAPPFNRDEMRESLMEFLHLYSMRPVRENEGGQGPVHLFLSWYAIKKINPSNVIESGTFKGLGTWVIEQALPSANVYSIDPTPSLTHEDAYTSKKTTTKYFHDKNHDFATINWKEFINDPEDCICFFDDHQSSQIRILQAYSMGFSKIMFEDNYPTGEGDMISPRHMLSNPSWYNITSDNSVMWKPFLDRLIKVYYELPPVFASNMTRWGTPWLESCMDPLLQDLEQHRAKYSVYFENRKAYTHMAYIEL